MASGGNLAPRLSNLARGRNEVSSSREWTRATKAIQVYTGLTIAGFVVLGEAPFRDKAGRLVWLCECLAAKHRVEVLHAALTYTAPTCSHCAKEAVLASLGGKETDAEWQQWWERHSIPRNRYSHREEREPANESESESEENDSEEANESERESYE